MDKSCQLIIGWDVIRESAGVTIIREVEVRVVRSPTWLSSGVVSQYLAHWLMNGLIK